MVLLAHTWRVFANKKEGEKGEGTKEKEKEIIREAKMKYKLGARGLEKVIEQVYGVHIPHNRIHKYLLEEGLAKGEPGVHPQK